jgi:hypothetical protein
VIRPMLTRRVSSARRFAFLATLAAPTVTEPLAARVRAPSSPNRRR